VRERQLGVALPITALGIEPHILLDVDGDKARSDIGFGLRHRIINKFDLFLSVWAVDPYFNSKSDAQDGNYLRQPFAYKASLRRQWSALSFFETRLNYETPILWQQSPELLYRYQRRMLNSLWAFALNDDMQLRLQADLHVKNESTETTRGDHTAAESIARIDQLYRLSLLSIQNQRRLSETAISWWSRQTEDQRFRFVDDLSFELEDFSNPFLRQEWSAFYRQSMPLNMTTAVQWGLYANAGWQTLGDDIRFFPQYKIQFAGIWSFSERAQLVIHAGIDLDRTYKGFTGQISGIHPWGGGGAQLQWTL
jgi:hypothetical protein